MGEQLKVGVIGATGMVGQRFVTLLANHPWFKVTVVAASKHSAGQKYGDAVKDRWKMGETPIPERVKDLTILDAEDVAAVASQVDFVFSAVHMDKDAIRQLEDEYAKHETPVVSNNSAHRWTPDVPMVVPEINPDHTEVIKYQRERLGTQRGFVAVKPNCSIQSYTPALAAWKQFEPTQVLACTYQAISGAGKTLEGAPEIQGNVIPYIPGEEKKSEDEPLKIWGHVDDEKKAIVPAESPVITSQCLRVPVLYGHTVAAFVNFKQDPTKTTVVNHNGWICRARLSSLSSTWMTTSGPRSAATSTLNTGWGFPLAASGQTSSLTGSLLACPTTPPGGPLAGRLNSLNYSRPRAI